MNNNQSVKQNNRIEWIDLAKGLTMLLVVVGHCLYIPGQTIPLLRLIRGLIFSFHMPLFFVLSMVTYKLSATNDMLVRKAEKAFRHLIIPTCVLFSLQTVLYFLLERKDESISFFLAKTVNTFIYSSGVEIRVGSEVIPEIGMIWFFVALFLSRTLYDYLHLKLSKKRFIIAICLLSVVGVVMRRIQYLPFSFDIVLAIMPFLYFGEYLKKVDLRKKLLIYSVVSLSVWLITLGVQFFINGIYLELAQRSYPLYPLCFLTAAAGVFFVICLSNILMKIRKVMIPFIFIGRNSMYFFWAHIMDYVLQPVWEDNSQPVKMVLLRLLIDIILFIAIVFSVKLIKHLTSKIKELKP